MAATKAQESRTEPVILSVMLTMPVPWDGTACTASGLEAAHSPSGSSCGKITPGLPSTNRVSWPGFTTICPPASLGSWSQCLTANLCARSTKTSSPIPCLRLSGRSGMTIVSTFFSSRTTIRLCTWLDLASGSSWMSSRVSSNFSCSLRSSNGQTRPLLKTMAPMAKLRTSVPISATCLQTLSSDRW